MGKRYLDIKENSLESSVFNILHGIQEEVKVDEGTKEEYEKFFNAALKKFKIDSPADLKSDEDKKKFFNYIDKNYTGEKDENFEGRLKETIGIKEEVVKEGTWQLPKGNQGMKGLKRLLAKPIELGKMAKNAKNKIDKYIGDDELFDDLEDAADKNPKGDAVPLIKKAMKRLNIKEELSLDEGKMSQMHQMIKDKKTPAQIAKVMGLDLKTVKALMASYEQMVPESFEIGTEKYLKHTVETTPGQKEWKETVSKKAASMRETLAKMWKVDEGKNVFAKDEKKDLTSEIKGGKTMTGKKVAEIDTKPTIKEKKK